MSVTIPTSEPSNIVRGDTAQWTRDLDFDPATWTLTYAFVRRDETPITQAATDNGDGKFAMLLTPATTATFAAGDWRYASRVTDGDNSYTQTRGVIIVEPDYATDTNVDPRSFAVRMVELLRARLERRAPSDLVQHSVEGFSSSVMSDAEARAQLQFWERRVRAEEYAEATRLGLPRTRNKTILVQMP